MKVFVIFGQRKGNYPGEYGLEALECMDENVESDNPQFLPTKLEELKASDEFESVEIVTLEVDEASVRSILFPADVAVKAKVLGQGA